jgi:hypothetical protein
MRRRWREPAAIPAEIDRIRSLRLDALRRQWRLVFGRVPAAGLSKDLLGRMIAARADSYVLPSAACRSLVLAVASMSTTDSERLNISARQDHPLLAAQKREQYLDPLMWLHSRVKRQVPSKWSA